MTSGSIFAVDSLHADCDADRVLALVHPGGPACHTSGRTCFGEGSTVDTPPEALSQLDATLVDRAGERPEGTYAVKLLDDVNLRLKKLGEETAELVAALATGDGKRAQEEVTDLLYTPWSHCARKESGSMQFWRRWRIARDKSASNRRIRTPPPCIG